MPISLIQTLARVWSSVTRRLFWGAIKEVPSLNGSLLIDRGHGLLYDVERDLTWLQDANYAQTSGRSPDGQLTWEAARTWVARLNYRGITGWRLPNARNPDGSGPCEGEHCGESELGHLMFTARLRPSPGLHWLHWEPFSIYWSGTEASATEAFAFKMAGLKQGKLAKDPWSSGPFPGTSAPLADVVRTWPVHDGDVSISLFRRLIEALFFRDRASAAGRGGGRGGHRAVDAAGGGLPATEATARFPPPSAALPAPDFVVSQSRAPFGSGSAGLE